MCFCSMSLLTASQLQIKLRHDPRHAQDATESEYLISAKSKAVKRPIDFDGRLRVNSNDQLQNGAAAPATASGNLNSIGNDILRKQKRR